MLLANDLWKCRSVLVNPSALPRFWIFMYRVTPVNYFVRAIISTGVAGMTIDCAANELITLDPPPPPPGTQQNRASYLTPYLTSTGGKLLNPIATRYCQLCPVMTTDAILASFGIYFADRWRTSTISFSYSVVNVVGALLLYWLVRIPKKPNHK